MNYVENKLSGQLAVILHADVAGSTALVREDEQLAHQRIQETFHRFGDAITEYHGHVRELRRSTLTICGKRDYRSEKTSNTKCCKPNGAW